MTNFAPDHRFAPLIEWLQIVDQPPPDLNNPKYLAGLPRSVSAHVFWVHAESPDPRHIRGAWVGTLRFGPAGGRWPWVIFGTLAARPAPVADDDAFTKSNITDSLGFSVHIGTDAGTGPNQQDWSITNPNLGSADISWVGTSNAPLPNPASWDYALNGKVIGSVDEGGVDPHPGADRLRQAAERERDRTDRRRFDRLSCRGRRDVVSRVRTWPESRRHVPQRITVVASRDGRPKLNAVA